VALKPNLLGGVFVAGRRHYCLIPRRWTLEKLKAGPACYSPGSHPHLTTEDLYGPRPLSSYPRAVVYDPGSSHIKKSFVGEGGQLDLGLVKWLRYPKVLQVAYQPAILTGAQIRGLSARVGEYLANASRRHEPWAAMMLIDIHRQAVPPSGNAPPLRQDFAAAMVELAVLSHEPHSA